MRSGKGSEKGSAKRDGLGKGFFVAKSAKMGEKGAREDLRLMVGRVSGKIRAKGVRECWRDDGMDWNEPEKSTIRQYWLLT